MESSIRIVYDPDAGEYVIEAYGTNSQHLGSRIFRTWAKVLDFLSLRPDVQMWLTQIAKNEITDEEAEREVQMWPI